MPHHVDRTRLTYVMVYVRRDKKNLTRRLCSFLLSNSKANLIEKLYFRFGWKKKRHLYCFIMTIQKRQMSFFVKETISELLTLGHLLTFPLPKTKFKPQSEGAGHKSRASCLQDLFSQWVIPTEAWPILNEMAVGQQIPAGLHCIIQLFWTHAPAVSELAAAIELLLPPICTQCIERLLQPCPHCLSSIPP